MTRGSNKFASSIAGCLALLVLAGSDCQAQVASSVQLSGVVRDFRHGFPDFKLFPSGAFNASAGSVDMALDAAGKPTYTGSGFIVASEWMNSGLDPIAPHMYAVEPGTWNPGTSGIGGVTIGGDGMIHVVVAPTIANDDDDDDHDDHGDDDDHDDHDDDDDHHGSYGDDDDDDHGDHDDDHDDHDDDHDDDDHDDDDHTIVDTYDSTIGAYGPGNMGGTPVYNVGATMPELTEPSTTASHMGTYAPAGSITSDIHCDSFLMGEDSSTTVFGDVTMIVEDSFVMREDSVLHVSPDSSLTIYVKGSFSIDEECTIGSSKQSANPGAVTILNLGSDDIELLEEVSLFANIVSPSGELVLYEESSFFGGFIGYSAYIGEESDVHWDESFTWGGSASVPVPDCGFVVSDVAGVDGGPTTGVISDPNAFANWFRTIPGDNVAIPHTINMPADASGVYTYDVFDFVPINFRGFGNDWGNRNRNFTFEARAVFNGVDCSSYFLEFQGAGDVWVYINGSLVMDIGGAQSGGRQTIELDRLALPAGVDHEIKFFYAQRVATVAPFRLRTNIPLRTNSLGTPMATALTD